MHFVRTTYVRHTRAAPPSDPIVAMGKSKKLAVGPKYLALPFTSSASTSPTALKQTILFLSCSQLRSLRTLFDMSWSAP
jgi:hypothetical protein